MGFEDEFASKEERLFSYYISELILGGWLKKAVYQPESFLLTEDKFVFAYEKKKDKNVPVNIKLTRGAKYTADWLLEWDRKSDGIFYWREGGKYKAGFYPYRKARAGNHVPFFATAIDHNITSYIDVKGGFTGRNNSSGVTFSNNQKWMMDKGIFIQKVVVTLDEKSVFYKTFTPAQVVIQEIYQKNCKHGEKGDTKLKFEPKLIEHFVKNKNNI